MWIRCIGLRIVFLGSENRFECPDLRYLLCGGVVYCAEIIVHLYVQPEVNRGPEITPKTHCSLRCDTSLTPDSLRNTCLRHSCIPREPVCSDILYGLRKSSFRISPGVANCSLFMCRSLLSVTVNNRNIGGVPVFEAKTDPPRVVYPNTQLPLPFSNKLLQPVPW